MNLFESIFSDDELLLEMHPSIRRAFDQGTHPLSKHPIFSKHGKAMSGNQYAHLMTQYKSRSGKEQFDPSDIMNTFRAITNIERQHQSQLKQLAIQIVCQVWKVDPSLFAEPELTQNISVDSGGGDDDGGMGEEEEETPLTPEQQEEVEKRITMNMLTHGSAIHMMTTMYHLAKDALEKLDPRLVKLYDVFSTSANLSSWYMDVENMLKLMGVATGGTEEIQWEGPPPTGETPQASGSKEGSKPKIKAKAMMFPILLHEMSKGVMELLTMHQLSSLEPDTLKKVYKHADKYEHEFFHFFVGPAVWRHFIKVVPREKLARVVAALSNPKLKSKDVTAFINAVVEDPEMAVQMISNLIKDPKGTVDEL